MEKRKCKFVISVCCKSINWCYVIYQPATYTHTELKKVIASIERIITTEKIKNKYLFLFLCLPIRKRKGKSSFDANQIC